jgi:acyl-CoA-binding protein
MKIVKTSAKDSLGFRPSPIENCSLFSLQKEATTADNDFMDGGFMNINFISHFRKIFNP